MNPTFAHPNVKRNLSLRKLLRTIHHDEAGSVSLETVLILGAIAIPILIVIIKFGWPRIKGYFEQGLEELETETDNAVNGH